MIDCILKNLTCAIVLTKCHQRKFASCFTYALCGLAFFAAHFHNFLLNLSLPPPAALFMSTPLMLQDNMSSF
jgi:hypothetical protein